MQLILNKYALLLFAASLFGYLAYELEQAAKQTPHVADYAQFFEQKLHETESEVDEILTDSKFLALAVSGKLPEDSIRKYQDKPYSILIYSHDYDSLVYWSNNKIYPYRSDMQPVNHRTSQSYNIRGSSYLKIQLPYETIVNKQTRSYHLVGLIPIYARYPIQNSYLSNQFELMSEAFSACVVATDDKTAYGINDQSGNRIIGLKAKKGYPAQSLILGALGGYFLASILLLLLVQGFSSNLVRKKGLALGVAFMFVSFLSYRALGVIIGFPFLSEELSFLQLSFSESTTRGFRSLDDLFINIGLLFWLVLFVRYHLRRIDFSTPKLRSIQYLITLGAYMTLALSIWVIYKAVAVLVLNSNISFEFVNFSKLDGFSFIALGAVAFLHLALFLLCDCLFRMQQHFVYPKKDKFLLLLSVLSIWGISCAINGWNALELTVFLGVVFLYAVLLNFSTPKENTSFLWIGIWLIFFSGFSTFLFENFKLEKDFSLRKGFAKKVAQERSPELEELISRIGRKILKDEYFKIYFQPVGIPRRAATERILHSYLDNNFFGRFKYTVYIYNGNNELVACQEGAQEKHYSEFNRIIADQQHTTRIGDEAIYFYSDPQGAYRYVARFTIKEKGNRLGAIVVEFLPKNESKKSNIYEEFLSLPKTRLEQLHEQFAYGLYKQNLLVEQKNGVFPPSFDLSQESIPKDSYRIRYNEEGPDHILYRGENGYISLVALPERPFWLSISIFSYICVFGVLILVLIIIVDFFYRKVAKTYSPLGFSFENSLRDRIQRGILLVSFVSFVAVAIITIIYFRYEYNNYHRSRLKRKIGSTAESALWQILQNADSSEVSIPEAKDLSKIHKIDVNLYSLRGKLISSSEEAIFERRLLSRHMNPIALFHMKKGNNHFIQNEEINSFEYLSAYVPLKDKKNEPIAYLNLPYDLAGNSNIRSQDVAEFLGALLNVYVILLILAGSAAFLIANTVTEPLRVIGEKLDELKLGAKNEAIQWNNNDEIGALVKQYNTMVRALEESAKELSRTQRESAWRDMAKQVAHEIKNPLTPMKLNIQLLQRVLAVNPEKAQGMVNRVSSALIEQIDNLANIACEFSDFAKMPVTKNEVFNLKELMNSVYDLFKEEENTALSLVLPEGREAFIFADKNQMMRVLNNLVKNAIQAIPEGRQGMVRLLLTVEATRALIKVSDNGCGIPEERKADVFIPNFTTKSSGTGIGLSMSKKIVEMAHGKIYLESVVDKGTDFFVDLPLHPIAI